MTKKRGRHPQGGGRVTPKGTRPRNFSRSSLPTRHDSEPDLLANVRARLQEEHPFGMLAEASSLFSALDPRIGTPFEQREPSGPTREEIIESFLDVDRIETSALLSVFAALTDDEVMRARIRRELAGRSDPVPPWVTQLDAVEAYRSIEQVHVLGDGDNVLVGVKLPGGDEMTVVVYIDHNLGRVAKDAFVVPEPIADLIRFMREKIGDDTGFQWNDIPLADARARIADAVELGARTYPPYESDSWPACRPLVEWTTRLLPEGGKGYEWREWRDDELNAIAKRFLKSPFAADLEADDDYVDLLHSLLWYGSGYGPGDPFHWSPTAVELILIDWIPRKLAAPPKFLGKAPPLLRAFIRFAHAERDISPALTDETLEAVDHWEPEFQAIIRSPRPQGPMALLAAMGVTDPDERWDLPGGTESWMQLRREALERAVGGPEVLEQLDDSPLPDEAFDWTGIPGDVAERVREVIDLCDRCCDEVLDAEYRTACRRVLARIATGDPNVFRRAGRPETAAAAICWSVGKANDLFGWWGAGMAVKDLLGHFGIQKGSVSQRAATLLRAGGFDAGDDVHLGSPDFLTSSRRRRIIEIRHDKEWAPGP